MTMNNEDDNYIYVDIPGTNMTVQVKCEYEGIVVDVFEVASDDSVEPIASTYKFYSELGVELKQTSSEATE